MSFLTQQPRDTLTEQMLLLDFETLNSICQVAPEIRIVCNDELFWRRKIALDFPEFPLEIPADATYKTTYRLLVSNDLLLGIRLDRADFVGYFLSRTSYLPREAIVTAVNYNAKDSLELLLPLDPRLSGEGMSTAARLNSVELIRLFIKHGQLPTVFTLSQAFAAGAVEAFDFILESINFPIQFGLVLDGFFDERTPLERERQKEMTTRLLERGEIRGDLELPVAAVIVDDPDLYSSVRRPALSSRILSYVWQHGSKEMVRAVLESVDNEIGDVSGISVDRLEFLLALGATISPDALFSSNSVEAFFYLVDRVAIDPNSAVAIAAVTISNDRIRDELLSGLRDRRLNLDREEVREAMYELGAGSVYTNEILDMFGL